MISDPNTNQQPPDEARADQARLREALDREGASAKDEAKAAQATVRDEASRLASSAKQKAYEGAESGKAYAAGNLDDFTAAIRKASDELGQRDQSMAANLVREAASGLEQVSRSIQGRSVQDLTRSVAGFARQQPAAFIIGAALAGVALGRFARASGEHEDRDYAARSGSEREDVYAADRGYVGATYHSASSDGMSSSTASTTRYGATSQTAGTGPTPGGASVSAAGTGSSSSPASSGSSPGATSSPGSARTASSAPSVTGGSPVSKTGGSPVSSTFKSGDDDVR